MKNGHSEDDTFHTLSSKTENFKSNFYYESVTLKLIDVKRKLSAKRVLWLFFTSFRCLEAIPEQSPWTSGHCCRNLSEKLQRAFL